MPADGHQVDVHRVDVDRDLPNRLRCVGVEGNFVLSAERTEFCDRLDGTYLVVDKHDGDERGVGADGCFYLFKVEAAVGLDWEVGDVKALLLEVAAGVEHAFVLGDGGDDVAFFVAVEVGDALDRDVVGLGGT